MTEPILAMNTATVAALIGVIVVTIKLVDKLVDGILKKRTATKSNGLLAAIALRLEKNDSTLDKVSERMVDICLTQQQISSTQAQTVTILKDMDNRFERSLNGLATRLEKELAGVATEVREHLR